MRPTCEKQQAILRDQALGKSCTQRTSRSGAMASSSSGQIPFAPPALNTYPYPGLDLNDSQAPRIIGTCVTLIIISTISVALRFLARRLSRAGLWWDDWTMLGALV